MLSIPRPLTTFLPHFQTRAGAKNANTKRKRRPRGCGPPPRFMNHPYFHKTPHLGGAADRQTSPFIGALQTRGGGRPPAQARFWSFYNVRLLWFIPCIYSVACEGGSQWARWAGGVVFTAPQSVAGGCGMCRQGRTRGRPRSVRVARQLCHQTATPSRNPWPFVNVQ